MQEYEWYTTQGEEEPPEEPDAAQLGVSMLDTSSFVKWDPLPPRKDRSRRGSSGRSSPMPRVAWRKTPEPPGGSSDEDEEAPAPVKKAPGLRRVKSAGALRPTSAGKAAAPKARAPQPAQRERFKSYDVGSDQKQGSKAEVSDGGGYGKRMHLQLDGVSHCYWRRLVGCLCIPLDLVSPSAVLGLCRRGLRQQAPRSVSLQRSAPGPMAKEDPG